MVMRSGVAMLFVVGEKEKRRRERSKEAGDS
jgi:hypothetical protein